MGLVRELTPAPKPNRPRDPSVPPKPRRPRDELGRPLPWTAEDRLELEDFDGKTLEENHRLGVDYWNAGRFFPAHEAWETCWKQAKDTPDGEFFKGMSQLGAGYVHLLRGNPHGAHTLLRRGASRVGRYPARHWGVPARELAQAALRHAEEIEAAERDGRALPRVQFPKI